MKYLVGTGIAAWAALGVLTYSTCVGRYDIKFPGWRNVEAASRVPWTCTAQAVIPITGLPLVLATNEWRWKLSW